MLGHTGWARQVTLKSWKGSSGGVQGTQAGLGERSKKQVTRICVGSTRASLGVGPEAPSSDIGPVCRTRRVTVPHPTAAAQLCALGPGSREQRLEDGDDRVLVGGHHQHTAELVEEHEQLGAPGVLIVHDLL